MKTNEEQNILKGENMIENPAELNKEESEQVTGSRGGHYMSMFCTKCNRSFMADVSQSVVYCTHCGSPINLFG